MKNEMLFATLFNLEMMKQQFKMDPAEAAKNALATLKTIEDVIANDLNEREEEIASHHLRG
jgi:hypothetical protein